MKILLKKTTALILSAFFVLTLSACSEGPAEEAGEKVDEGVTDIGNAAEDKCEDLKEGVDAKDEDC